MTRKSRASSVKVHAAELVRVADLKPHPKNYREHPEDQVAHLEDSITEHGLYRNVVIARDGTVLAGHGVLAAVTKMGVEEIPVIRLDVDPFDEVALKVLVGDNEIARLALDDDRALTDLLQGIQDAVGAEGLFGTGFNAQMLAALAFVTHPLPEPPGPETASEPPLYRLTLAFSSEAERTTFVRKKLGAKVRAAGGGVVSMRWPLRQSKGAKGDSAASTVARGDA